MHLEMGMSTSRDVYRLLVQEGGFSPDEYEQWLAGTLVDAMVSLKNLAIDPLRKCLVTDVRLDVLRWHK